MVSSDAAQDSYGGNFDLFGYESTLALINYGDAWLAVLIFFGFMLISYVAKIVLLKLNKLPFVLKYLAQ